MYKEILSEKLEQLDWLYSARTHLAAKADILSEMIEICRVAGIEVVGTEEWEALHVKALTAYDPKSEAKLRVALNAIKARLIKECVEAGLLKKFKEIPIAGELEGV